MSLEISSIRNFSIIAHIDHGKSTLADRMLEYTGTLAKREMRNQVLDNMDLERERGITIKAQAVRMEYRGFHLNLIDTPGHVDFSYEVSRSLTACEGALLLVDASQGIEAQTMANAHLALAADLEIIPVVNKIDLSQAQVERTVEEVIRVFGFKREEIILASGKTGQGVEDILEAIITRVPAPKSETNLLRALVFDSRYDPFRGVIAFIRLFDGELKPGMHVTMLGTGGDFEVQETGYLKPAQTPSKGFSAGEVGYLIAGVRDVRHCRVGDTITSLSSPATKPLAGYRPAKPVVFCGFYPIQGEDYESLRDAVSKLQLNDAAFFYEPETSEALGFGFRCGFLGLLHLEIVQERLEREFGLNVIATSPSVVYRLFLKNGSTLLIDSPTKLPPYGDILSFEEPYCHLTVFVPSEYVGAAMDLAISRRAVFKRMEYLDATHATLEFTIPFAKIIAEFHDQLKAVSRGYASMDYEVAGYIPAKLSRLDILLNQEPVDALSVIIHTDEAQSYGRSLALKLKEAIPRQNFAIPIQAAVGGKVVARETVPALRKDVLAKCYGGDVTRKRKLLEKQKEGKKRMKRIGHVDVPQEAFLSVLRMGT